MFSKCFWGLDLHSAVWLLSDALLHSRLACWTMGWFCLNSPCRVLSAVAELLPSSRPWFQCSVWVDNQAQCPASSPGSPSPATVSDWGYDGIGMRTVWLEMRSQGCGQCFYCAIFIFFFFYFNWGQHCRNSFFFSEKRLGMMVHLSWKKKLL